MSILMTVEELAKYLKIKPDTIYKKVRKGELPAIKLGKLVRFPKDLIDQWLVEQATKTMKEFKAAKEMVEAKVEEAVEKVETVVEQAKEQAESAVAEVMKTQEQITEHLTKGIKNLWTDINSTITKVTSGTMNAPQSKKVKKPTKTMSGVKKGSKGKKNLKKSGPKSMLPKAKSSRLSKSKTKKVSQDLRYVTVS